jgi:hypothetical protein
MKRFLNIIFPWRRIQELEVEIVLLKRELESEKVSHSVTDRQLKEKTRAMKLVNDWIMRNHRTERMPDMIFSRE